MLSLEENMECKVYNTDLYNLTLNKKSIGHYGQQKFNGYLNNIL
jgi:hypothetical protein